MHLKLPKDGAGTVYVPIPAMLLSRIGIEFVAQAQAGARWFDEDLARDLADLLTAFDETAADCDIQHESSKIQPCQAFRGRSNVTSERSKVAVSRARKG